ncbi:MAG: ribonucleoside-diphosphate reductase subunit alpha [Candidatus Omnitrophica bacterium]|nr:ribonucleoside-diphosphate reductase subunit alpha [Candidatus Omnitrophota bacterium]
MLEKIRKRTGELADFDAVRIREAIAKAVAATRERVGTSMAGPFELPQEVSDKVVSEIEQRFGNSERIVGVEDIQDIVERKLAESGYFEVAREFILYRAEHAHRRAERRIEELRKLEKNLLKVSKHDGSQEAFDPRKLRKVFDRASRGFEATCRFDDVFAVLKNRLVDGISTDQVIENLKRSCIDLLTIQNTDWQIVAGRLLVMQLYKSASRNRKVKIEELYSPSSYQSHFENYLKKGFYYKDFLKYYTPQEIGLAASFIDRGRDFSYIYSTVLALNKRYLCNPNKIVAELPQEMYLTVALFLAIPEPKEKRLDFARVVYEATSTQKLSLPTPTLINARTNFTQLSSCFKLNVADDLRAIYHAIENMAQISKFGGGVGAYLGHIRSKGGDIRGVKSTSGGVVPWVRVINDTAAAVNQLGARFGAISPTLDIWHRDILDFLNLQTETGDIRRKAFDIFPAVSIPDVFMRRVEAGDNWTLFDPHEVYKVTGRALEDVFDVEFTEFYESCEQDERLKLRVTTNAKDLMKRFLKTAVETGMPYAFFRDTVNRLNPNKHAGMIYSTQLCTEICQNTSSSVFEGESVEQGKVALRYTPGDTVVCNLASINVAKVNTHEEIERIIPVAMRVLDNVITLNLYPIKEAELTAHKYRSVGLGFMGLAEYLACQKLTYDSPEARNNVDVLFEKYALVTLQASNALAKERGAYPLFKGSDWEKGIIFGRQEGWYEKESHDPNSWQELIADIRKNGLRFAYHLAPAPNTSTSGIVGTTAGLLPVYKKFFMETNAIAPIVTVAPNLSKENFWFYKEYANMEMDDVIEMIAVVYKWIDQSISFEWMINPSRTSPKQLFDYYIKAWKSGIKTVYYVRSMSGDVKDGCVSCSG